jgi:hypothetical protein
MANMRFPEPDELLECSWWCEPIHKVERAIAGEAFARYFSVDDFQLAGQLRRSGRPHLILQKHSLTRRYLNLDQDGHAYCYVAPRDPNSLSNGRYVPFRDLVEAIDHLDLYEVPWMTDEHAADRLGLDWDQRWCHPNVVAWRQRRNARRDSQRAAPRPKKQALRLADDL